MGDSRMQYILDGTTGVPIMCFNDNTSRLEFNKEIRVLLRVIEASMKKSGILIPKDRRKEYQDFIMIRPKDSYPLFKKAFFEFYLPRINARKENYVVVDR